MTAELAESVGSFTRTLVHDCDLVPRTCVYSLSLLRAELEEQRDAVYANNSLLGSIKASGLLDSGGQLLTQAGVALLASKVCFLSGCGCFCGCVACRLQRRCLLLVVFRADR